MATKRTLIGNIKGPKGDTGAQGPQGATGPGATIEVGTVSTTAYGNTAQVTNSGTATAAVLDFVIPQGKPGEQTTKMSGLTLDTVTASTAEYPIPATGDTGSVAWGKVIKFFNDAKTAIASKINISDIVNNLTSTSTNKPLSAAQGKALNDALGNKVGIYADSLSSLPPTGGSGFYYISADITVGSVTLPQYSRAIIVNADGSLDASLLAVDLSNGSFYTGERHSRVWTLHKYGTPEEVSFRPTGRVVTDANTVEAGVAYMGGTYTNAPEAYGILVTFGIVGYEYRAQIYIPVSGNNFNFWYRHRLSNGSWIAWRKLVGTAS